MTGGSVQAAGQAGAVQYRVATASSAGAIAIVQLWGRGLPAVLNRLTAGAVPGRWGLMELRLMQEAGEGGDEAVVAWLGEQWCQIMPHGGVRVVQRLVERLREAGAEPAGEGVDARLLYPEAATPIEADMLHTMSRAASPAAVDVLLDQPRLWAAAATDRRVGRLDAAAIAARSAVLDRLIEPPMVVVVGPPNVGKSTLTNYLSGRAASLTADLPGTTRDWVAASVMLESAETNAGGGAVAVRWLDTPGVHQSDDPIEQRAIEMARQVIAAADVVISLREPGGQWLDEAGVGRPADLRVLNKVDQLEPGAAADDADVRISAATGEGLDALGTAVLGKLGVGEAMAAGGGLWAFSPALRELIGELHQDPTAAMRKLGAYVGC